MDRIPLGLNSGLQSGTCLGANLGDPHGTLAGKCCYSDEPALHGGLGLIKSSQAVVFFCRCAPTRLRTFFLVSLGCSCCGGLGAQVGLALLSVGQMSLRSN